MSDHKATKTVLLPQYINSPLVTERFLDAIHDPIGEIEISAKYSGLKVIEKAEYELDGLNYFTQNKAMLQAAFDEECVKEIGRNKTQEYYNVISNIWYSSKSIRTGELGYPLLRSIENYFTEFKRIPKENILVRNQPDFGTTNVLFEPETLDKIFRLNNRMVNWALSEWIKNCSKGEAFATDDIYLRRGITLDGIMDDEIFKEQNYVNSYTLSLTVTEQFCQLPGTKPSIMNLPYNNSLSRILFFSPFILNQNLQLAQQNYEQLEFGIVPPFSEIRMHLQDEHDIVAEYMLEYSTPF